MQIVRTSWEATPASWSSQLQAHPQAGSCPARKLSDENTTMQCTSCISSLGTLTHAYSSVC